MIMMMMFVRMVESERERNKTTMKQVPKMMREGKGKCREREANHYIFLIFSPRITSSSTRSVVAASVSHHDFSSGNSF